jgi:hypothetical protein
MEAAASDGLVLIERQAEVGKRCVIQCGVEEVSISARARRRRLFDLTV